MTSTRAAPSALRGAAASLAGLGAAELMATTAGTSLIDGVGRLVVDSGPRQLVDAVVHAVGTKDKPVIRAAVGAGVVGAGALLARQPPARRDATMAVVAAAGAAAALRRPPRRPLPTAIAVGTGTMISRQVLRARPRGRTGAGLLVVGAASIATSRRQRHRQIRSWTQVGAA